jgi:hypothetical protein
MKTNVIIILFSAAFLCFSEEDEFRDSLKLVTYYCDSTITIGSTGRGILPALIFKIDKKDGQPVCYDSSNKEVYALYTRNHELIQDAKMDCIVSVQFGDTIYIGTKLKRSIVKDTSIFVLRKLNAFDVQFCRILKVRNKYRHCPDINKMVISCCNHNIPNRFVNNLISISQNAGFKCTLKYKDQ